MAGTDASSPSLPPAGSDADERDAAALAQELQALRSRRVVRLGLLLSTLASQPRQILRLPRLLIDALRPRPTSSGPTRRGGRPRTLQLTAPARRRRHPHLRFAHHGPASYYAGLVTHVSVEDPGDLDERHDLLLATAPPPAALVARARELGLPVVVAPGAGAGSVALATSDPTALATSDPAGLATSDPAALATGDPTALATSGPDLLVTDDAEVAAAVGAHLDADRVLHLPPAVDVRRSNPIGWVREPERGVLLVVARPPSDAALDWLAQAVEVRGEATVLLADGIDADALGKGLTGAAIETLEPATLPARVKAHRVVLAHPGLHHDASAHARHVLDVLACGTPAVHPPDAQLADLVPAGLRLEAATGADAAEQVRALVDPDARERASIPLRRHVLAHHALARRIDQLLARLDIPTPPTPTVSVLLCTNRPEMLDHAHEQIARQDHPALEIITICHGDGFDADHLTRLAARHDHPTRMLNAPAHWPLGDALNLGLDHATGQLVTKMDDDDHYGPSHLTDLVLALEYSRADVVGKLANFVHLTGHDLTMDRYLEHQESFVWHLPGATLLTHRELLAAYRFPRVRRAVDTRLYERLHRDGARRYSTHRFGFVRHRGETHTYARSDEEFLDQAVHRYPGLALDRTEL